MKIDLHIHSHYSDGVLSPAELIERAMRENVKVMSLTDHDNVNGIEKIMHLGKRQNIEVIPGIEISANMRRQEFHILGYYIDYKSDVLHYHLKKWADYRSDQVENMCDNLNKMGYKIDFDNIKEMAKSRTMGVHLLAIALLQAGYVESIDESIRKLTGKMGAAYVERNDVHPKEAVNLIRECKGIPVLAHPCTSKNTDYIDELIAHGLNGIEVYYSSHTIEHIKYLETLAIERGLLMTGGSDFHGPGGPHWDDRIEMGSVQVPYSCVEGLKSIRYKRGNPIEYL